MHRKLLAIIPILGCSLGTLSASQAQQTAQEQGQQTAQEKEVQRGAVQAIRGLAGVQIQEKDGQIVGIDFRKCPDDWANAFPSVLGIPSIQSVSVTGPRATHDLIVSLAGLPNLRSLRMEQCSISDATVAAVSRFPKIEDVNLDRCPITDESMKSLVQSKTIRRIRVPRTDLTGLGLAHLKNATQLELLDLTDCKQISDTGVAHLQGLTKLRNRSLRPGITDAGMQHLG